MDLTCHSIANDIKKLATHGELFICGGGAYNSALMRRLDNLLPGYRTTTTRELGVSPKWVEAIAFAWLAMRYQHNLPANLPAVTGASRATVLGARYCAD